MNSALQPLAAAYLKELTVSSGRVSLLLVRAQEHGESRIRHVEALRWSRKTQLWVNNEYNMWLSSIRTSLVRLKKDNEF